MFFKSYILNTVFKNQPLDLTSEEIRNVIASLITPKKATLAALSVTTTFILYKLFTRISRDKEIPEFPGAAVFSGHRSLIGKTTSEGEFARALNPAKLSLGYFRVIFMRILLLCDLKVWKEIFLTNGNASSGRTLGYPFHMDAHFKHAIVFSTGEPWKINRRIFLNYLRQLGREKLFEVVLEEVGYLLETIGKTPNSLEPSHVLAKAFCNVISTLTCGSRFEYSDPEIQTIIRCIGTFNLPNPFIPEFLWPIFAKFPVTSSLRLRKNGIKQMKACIKRKIEPLLKSGPRNPPETMVEAYALDVMEKSSGQLNVDSLTAIIHELFFGGTAASSTTIQWFVACMASHLEVQEKLFQEVEAVVGDGKLNLGHLKELNYLLAVQFEVQRFACIVQTAFPHIALKDIKLTTGETIKKGQVILSSIHWVMRQKELWKKPEEFCPDNFLDKSGKFTTNEAFVPYGMGPRMCVGQNLADLELKVAMCEIIRKFRITSDEKVDLGKIIPRHISCPYPYEYNFLAR